MKYKISRGVPGLLLVKMKHLKGDIVHYSETVLEWWWRHQTFSVSVRATL